MLVTDVTLKVDWLKILNVGRIARLFKKEIYQFGQNVSGSKLKKFTHQLLQRLNCCKKEP